MIALLENVRQPGSVSRQKQRRLVLCHHRVENHIDEGNDFISP